MNECLTCGRVDTRLIEGPGGFEFAECLICGLLTRTGGVNSAAYLSAKNRPTTESSDPAVVALRHPIYEGVLRLIKDRVSPGNLLDVGCSTGEFMIMARGKGWMTKGFEEDNIAAKIAAGKGLDVESRAVEKSDCPKNSFDAATIIDVLDLAENPAAIIREVWRVLKPGGFAVIRVRNSGFHRLAWALGGRLGFGPLFNLAVLHTFGFNAINLRRFLEKYGFCGISIVNSIGDSAAYSRGGFTHFAGRIWEAFSGFAFWLTGGRRAFAASIIAICRKPNSLPRVMHVITRLDFGGSAENVILAARAHAEKGFNVLVACGPSKTPTATSADGFFELRIIDSLVRPIRPVSDFAALIAIRRLLKAWQPDIVHTHSSKAGILGRWACIGLPIRIIHQPHGHVFYGYFGRIKTGVFVLVERITAWLTDDFIALSEGEKRESLELGIGEPGQWRVIHSGVALNGAQVDDEQRMDIRSRINVDASEIVVGTVARLEPVKGVDTLIEAIPRILARATEVRFLIVGDGGESAILHKRCRALKIENAVIFAGYQENPFPWMSAMDIYAQPSLNEGMGKTLVMAQSLRLPVVATRVCGIPDVVLDGRSGILVPEKEPARLADAIIQLIEHPEARRRFGTAGREWVVSPDSTGYSRFSDQAMAKHLDDLYLKKTT